MVVDKVTLTRGRSNIRQKRARLSKPQKKEVIADYFYICFHENIRDFAGDALIRFSFKYLPPSLICERMNHQRCLAQARKVSFENKFSHLASFQNTLS